MISVPVVECSLLTNLETANKSPVFVAHDVFLKGANENLPVTQVRHLLKQGKSVEGMVGKAVARYIRDNAIAERVSGRQKWTVEVRHGVCCAEINRMLCCSIFLEGTLCITT